MTSFGRTKVKKRPRVSKYIEFGKAYLPRVCKDIQELAQQSKKFLTMKSLDGVNKKNDVNNTASEAPEKM